MTEARRKMKRIEPLIKAKRSIMENEATVLSIIKKKKIETVAKMKEYQKMYMDGVDKLNAERESHERSMLLTLEENLDYVKGKWHELFMNVRKIEAQEKAQLSLLEKAQQSLKSFEHLQGQYKDQFTHEQNQFEQKALDEVATRRHIIQKTTF